MFVTINDTLFKSNPSEMKKGKMNPKAVHSKISIQHPEFKLRNYPFLLAIIIAGIQIRQAKIKRKPMANLNITGPHDKSSGSC